MRLEKKYPPIGEFALIEDQKIHFLELGPKDAPGPPLVILHGASANLNDTKLALGDKLAKNHRVILIDRPGRGYSTRPDNGHDLDVQAQLIHQTLEYLDVEKPILIGQSLGGAVALAYTLRYQERMSAAVLLAAVSHEWPGRVTWYNKASGIPILGPLLRRTIIPYYGQWVAPKGVAGTFWPQAAPIDYYEKAGIALLFRSKDFKSNAADVSHLKDNIKRMQERYAEIKIPVEIFVGTHDTTVSPTIHSYRLAKQIEGANLTIINQVGHGLHHSAATQIITAIDALSKQISTPPPVTLPSPTNESPLE